MGKQLIAARNDLESRFNDMDLMIRILELDENKKIENQLLLKSSLLLMVYNAIEGTYINQARVHQGYHYPRSISTAMKSAGYFERFNKDYAFCVNKQFDQIYATSSQYSWSDGKQFKAFCKAANIPCEELNPGNYFKEGMCDGVFRTREYTYDAMILKDYLLEELKKFPGHVEIKYGVNIISIEKLQDIKYDSQWIEVTVEGDASSCKYPAYISIQ